MRSKRRAQSVGAATCEGRSVHRLHVAAAGISRPGIQEAVVVSEVEVVGRRGVRHGGSAGMQHQRDDGAASPPTLICRRAGLSRQCCACSDCSRQNVHFTDYTAFPYHLPRDSPPARHFTDYTRDFDTILSRSRAHYHSLALAHELPDVLTTSELLL